VRECLLTFSAESFVLQFATKIKIYRIIMLPVAWYGYETWSLKLREECRLRVLSLLDRASS